MLTLIGATYRPIMKWPNASEVGATETIECLGNLLKKSTKTIMSNVKPSQVKLNYVVSTILDLPFTSGWMSWDKLSQSASLATLPKFDNFVSAYECGAWGYCLRYANQVLTSGDLIIIHILDINIFDFEYWKNNINWGKSGFGLATILLRFSKSNHLECHLAKSYSGYGEFCLDLRRINAAMPDHIIVPPFFPEDIASMYTRLLPADIRTKNLSSDYGHCFGSDPWISLITETKEKNQICFNRPYLATSVALNGYWTFAEVELEKDGLYEIIQDE